jgi:tricorn protease
MGTRTWGGLVGIQGGLPLVDGGNVTSPGFGIFDTRRSEWIAENKGVDPDIAVDNDPSVIARGDDLQLRRAVEHLLDELKKGKGRKPIKTPPFPRRDGPL